MVSKALLEWVLKFKADHGRNPERHELPQLEGEHNNLFYDIIKSIAIQ